jgi:hypothetical protein
MRFTPALALAAAIVLSGCQANSGGSATPPLESAANATSAMHPANSRAAAPVTDRSAWSEAVNQMRPPSVGCFTVSFPATTWSQVPCTTAAPLHSHNVGYGNDYAANGAPHTIAYAEGWFPSAVGLKSVASADSGPGWSGTNAYSLQLNSQFFATSSCGAIEHCNGWVQFVYQNPPGKSEGDVEIWDWLVTTTSKHLSGCPPSAGWTYSGGDCVQTSRALAVPNQSILNLAKMSIVGEAAADGDTIIFTDGDTKYAIRNAQKDDLTDLATHWQGAEFNVFAPGDGATAMFNAGTTIAVGITVHDGSKKAPACQGYSGTTAELNNLALIAAPESDPVLAYPSIRFRESNLATTGKASCRSVAGT